MKNIRQPCTLDYSKLIGTPYNIQDCWGIAREFYRIVFNIDLKRYYDEIPQNRDIAKGLVYTNKGDFKEVSSPQFGDLILIKLFGIESHIAIYIDENTILHTQHRVGCNLDKLSKWKRLIVGYYRLEE